MPENVEFSPQEHLMKAEELESIAKEFVQLGVNKIRITGGEPFARKDIGAILLRLSQLPVSLHMTSNGVLLKKHRQAILDSGLKSMNISLDSLDAKHFKHITRRDDFEAVMDNIAWLSTTAIQLKLNIVLMRGVNDHEIEDFIDFAIQQGISIRFIEFMPFKGNQWSMKKRMSHEEVEARIFDYLGDRVQPLPHLPHETSRNYQVVGSDVSIGLISTVSKPFCADCNRLRLTADGKLKNCLFSQSENDLLTALRNGEALYPIIADSVYHKKKERGGEDFGEEQHTENNRSMVRIGG
ncbi:GTP 3',8-cyclase MoaA [Algivirga pacifica]|uniref:GTP 3',8-cyclase MoaA n=2 Tax=Algivirga pacifica TaxID=1162670 RepID=A0ABP9D614_9BACT